MWDPGGETSNTVCIAPLRTVRIGSITNNGHKVESRSELDNHADTCVVGPDTALLIHDFDRPVRVHGYKEDVGTVNNCRTVSVVLVYDHPESGKVYMLVLYRAILIEQMTANLLSPMQLRDNDLRVNDEPKFMVPKPTEGHHAVIIQETDEKEGITIPLSLNGVTSYFPTRKPT